MTPVLLGLTAVGTETGLWLYEHQAMQGATDSAAMSAGNAIAAGNSDFVGSGSAVAAQYGFVNGVGNASVAINQPPTSGPNVSTPGAVEVIISQPQKRLLSAVLLSNDVVVSARSVAVSGQPGTGCVVALDGTASIDINAKGNPQVVLDGCSVYDNSSSSTALNVSGSATLSALAINVVGGVSGIANITTVQGIHTGVLPIGDPYANVQVPSFSGCDHTNFSAQTTMTISPGVYCGGMTLNAGANVTLNPGVYIIAGGSLSVNGQAKMQGTGVTFVFTSNTSGSFATATINGGATINITAPTTGAMAGLVMYNDRSAPTGESFKLNGGSTQNFGGAVYLPKAAITFTGGSTTGNGGCTQLIADTIIFGGNSNLANNCKGSGIKGVGTTTTKLVE